MERVLHLSISGMPKELDEPDDAPKNMTISDTSKAMSFDGTEFINLSFVVGLAAGIPVAHLIKEALVRTNCFSPINGVPKCP